MAEEIESREVKDSGEDELLKQIDAFRDKAMQLTKLIGVRERKVKELEALVRAKEAKNQELQDQNQELQDSLVKKQQEADSLVLDVNRKVDEMMSQVNETMGSIEERISSQVAGNEENAAQQTQAVQDSLSGVKENLTSVSEGLGSIKDELSEKVHSENVKVYRNIQDLLTEMTSREEDQNKEEKHFRSIRGINIFSLILNIVNVGAFVTLFLYLMGYISF
ncbi:MAG: hypothetical protein PUG16_02680 [Lachnospiraceae bacterium]|jgi:hypothetical protein|nr:hypothetical protein [Lachnospiraceae bacterium]